MITAVTHYKKAKSFLERMGEIVPTVLNPKSMMRFKSLLKQSGFAPEVYRDFVEVTQDPRMIEVDKILADYANARITQKRMRTLLTDDEKFDYRLYISEGKKNRSGISSNHRHSTSTWITGASGTGKTCFAYFLARQHYEDDEICKANAGDHMFDNYDLHPVLFIDEMKGDKMKFSIYLLLTDNDSNVNMPARYSDANLSNLKELYMASTNLPSQTYACMQEVEGEDIYQAYRRLGFHYYEIVREGRRGPKGIVYDVKLDSEGSDPTKIIEKVPVYNVEYPKDSAPIFTPYTPF